jgi:invasion protein IalB
MIRRWAAYGISAVVLAGSAFAAGEQDPSPLGESGDWAAYAYKAGQGKVCYVVSQPKASQPKGAKRDPIFFLITHRPSQGIKNEVSTIIGYAFKKDATVEVKVDEAAYQLFTNGDGAWADTKDKDRKIVASMKKGKALSVKGTSVRGTATIDAYSLKGFGDAMAKIDGACK